MFIWASAKFDYDSLILKFDTSECSEHYNESPILFFFSFFFPLIKGKFWPILGEQRLQSPAIVNPRKNYCNVSATASV